MSGFQRRLPRVLLLVGLLAPLPHSQAEEGDRLVAAFDELRREVRIPGLSIAVVDHGELILQAGLGVADVDTGRLTTAETPYDIASVTKPISAVVALRLVEEGVLDLDTPIAEYSEWVDFCERFREQPSIFARDLRCEPAVHTLRHLFSHTATGVPGRHFSYNPILYSWGSRPIMAATGKTFSELVAEYVLRPAQMSGSARRYRDLALPAEIAEALAPPHRIEDDGRVVRAERLGAQGDGAAGGVVSTVVDLARFDIALDGGQLLSAESRRNMMTPYRNFEGEPQPYGIGWFLQDHAGERLVWHSGWWEDAYSAIYLKVPERRVTLILLANSEGLWWGNPLDEARIEDSAFARVFLDLWLD